MLPLRKKIPRAMNSTRGTSLDTVRILFRYLVVLTPAMFRALSPRSAPRQ